MILVLFYRVVLTVTVSILFFHLGRDHRVMYALVEEGRQTNAPIT